jgi:predicted kinase
MKPILIIMVGLIGTGKTTVAKALAERLGLEYISSDETRKRLAGIPETEHRYGDFNEGIYSPAFTGMVYKAMLVEAETELGKGKSVILDASFASSARRDAVGKLAGIRGADFCAVECVASEAVIKERLSNRRDTPSDGTWEVYLEQKKVFELPDEIPAEKLIVVDTAKPIGEIVDGILEEGMQPSIKDEDHH